MRDVTFFLRCLGVFLYVMYGGRGCLGVRLFFLWDVKEYFFGGNFVSFFDGVFTCLKHAHRLAVFSYLSHTLKAPFVHYPLT